jgi:hypothetical protein
MLNYILHVGNLSVKYKMFTSHRIIETSAIVMLYMNSVMPKYFRQVHCLRILRRRLIRPQMTQSEDIFYVCIVYYHGMAKTNT